MHMVLYRFLFACLGMAPVLLTHRVRLTAGELRTLLLAAALGIPLQFLLQFHGLALTTVSHAALMVGVMPVMLAAAAVFVLPARGWIGGAGWQLFCFDSRCRCHGDTGVERAQRHRARDAHARFERSGW